MSYALAWCGWRVTLVDSVRDSSHDLTKPANQQMVSDFLETADVVAIDGRTRTKLEQRLRRRAACGRKDISEERLAEGNGFTSWSSRLSAPSVTTSTMRMNGKPSGPSLGSLSEPKMSRGTFRAPQSYKMWTVGCTGTQRPNRFSVETSALDGSSPGLHPPKTLPDPGRQRRCLLTMPRYDRRSTPPAPCACLGAADVVTRDNTHEIIGRKTPKLGFRRSVLGQQSQN